MTLKIQNIDLIFIFILATFRPICPSAFFGCLMLNPRVHKNWDVYGTKTSDMIVERSISWFVEDIRFINPPNPLWIVRQGYMAQWIRRLVGRCSLVKSSAGSIPTTGKNNNGYLLQRNTCIWLGLTELEQSIPLVQVKASVQDSEFDIKHLKKAEGHRGRNVTSIKMRSVVQIF